MKTSVIVLSYNTRELTLNCLRQFATEADRAGWQIILVDNASHDETVPAVRREFPQVEVICSEEIWVLLPVIISASAWHPVRQ